MQYHEIISDTYKSIWYLMMVLLGAYQSKVINESNTKNSHKALPEALTKHTGSFILDWLTQKNKWDDGIDKENH